ncbi:MAG: GNAT family N-acetyltransferase [Acidimicrobiales bacterium]
MTLRLRPYQLNDEAAALAIHEAMLAENFHFLLYWNSSLTWTEFLAALDLQRRGSNLAKDQVRAVQLAAEVDGELVGRASIRFQLNDFLLMKGGHVGYGVAPAYRGRGYASEILRQALVILRADGVDRALVTCDDGNVASMRTIEGSGGVLESIVPSNGNDPPIRRYWFE